MCGVVCLSRRRKNYKPPDSKRREKSNARCKNETSRLVSAAAGNRTPVGCLEGSKLNHLPTAATHHGLPFPLYGCIQRWHDQCFDRLH
eukprot:jgi/Botrbrau1/10652/Bobra.53_2s0010.1